jgi:hypothetical protein
MKVLASTSTTQCPDGARHHLGLALKVCIKISGYAAMDQLATKVVCIIDHPRCFRLIGEFISDHSLERLPN